MGWRNLWIFNGRNIRLSAIIEDSTCFTSTYWWLWSVMSNGLMIWVWFWRYFPLQSLLILLLFPYIILVLQDKILLHGRLLCQGKVVVSMWNSCSDVVLCWVLVRKFTLVINRGSYAASRFGNTYCVMVDSLGVIIHIINKT